MTEKLGGLYLDLVAPKMYARRWDVMFHARRLADDDEAGWMRVGCAALGLCWPELAAKIPAYNGELLMWSEHVFQYLVQHGAAYPEIAVAATRAINMCLDELPGGSPAVSKSAAAAVGN